MPNWCSNYVYIKGNQTVIDKICKEINGEKEYPKLFSLFYPVPEELNYTVSHPPTKTDEEMLELEKKYGSKDWYDWSINNWGCKWDAREIEIMESDLEIMESYPKEICLRFDTPWGPPTDFYTKLANDYKVELNATYTEEGMSFFGKWQSIVKDSEVYIHQDDHDIDKMQDDILFRYLAINKDIKVTPSVFLDKVRCLYEKIYPEVCDYYDSEEMFGDWWLENELEEKTFCKKFGIINETTV